MEVFDLKNLKDLPTPKEIEEFGSELAEEMDESEYEGEAAEISDEETEETVTSSTSVASETAAENPQTRMEPNKTKPD